MTPRTAESVSTMKDETGRSTRMTPIGGRARSRPCARVFAETALVAVLTLLAVMVIPGRLLSLVAYSGTAWLIVTRVPRGTQAVAIRLLATAVGALKAAAAFVSASSLTSVFVQRSRWSRVILHGQEPQ